MSLSKSGAPLLLLLARWRLALFNITCFLLRILLVSADGSYPTSIRQGLRQLNPGEVCFFMSLGIHNIDQCRPIVLCSSSFWLYSPLPQPLRLTGDAKVMMTLHGVSPSLFFFNS